MKTLFTLILLTFFTINSNGQIISNYGIKLGLGMSNQSWDYQWSLSNGFKNKIGISPRIFVDFFNSSFFQLEGEIGFLRKGFEEKIPITTVTQPDGTGEFIISNNGLDYLSLSILAKFKFESDSFSPYIIVGPQLNFFINENVGKAFEGFFNNFKGTNIGLSIGAGTEVKNILPITILLEYRYEKDLKDNFDSSFINIKNYSHVILLGIKI